MQSLRILAVEDHKGTLDILTSQLEQMGHSCIGVETAEEALSKLQEKPDDFDVLLTDWMLPGIDGAELIRKLRTQDREAYLYIMLITVLEEKKAFLEGMDAGADDYLMKPVDADELRARLGVANRLLSLNEKIASQSKELAALRAAN